MRARISGWSSNRHTSTSRTPPATRTQDARHDGVDNPTTQLCEGRVAGAGEQHGRIQALERLVDLNEEAGSVLIETHDEWRVTGRRYLSEGAMARLDQPAITETEVANTELLSASSTQSLTRTR